MVWGCWVLTSASARSWAGKLLGTEGTWPRDPTVGSAGARGAQGANSAPRGSQACWDLVLGHSPMEQPRAEQGTPQAMGIPIPNTPRADFGGQGLFALPMSRPPFQPSQITGGAGKPELLMENAAQTPPEAGSPPGGADPAFPHSADGGHQQQLQMAQIRAPKKGPTGWTPPLLPCAPCTPSVYSFPARWLLPCPKTGVLLVPSSQERAGAPRCLKARR